ncbi:MAG: virulence protein RhuM/Fic/DOC family protein [Candidatus Gribaldobacteria bacterium]|nr:virulence protein RhuM/Fic/DOC family protein [Candidatus Gribaldobacteria bacterium]
MKKSKQKSQVIIYQAKSGAIELRGDFSRETVWATQAQIAKIFDVTPQNITLHLRNIFKENELNKESTCKEFLQVQTEGGREIKRSVKIYNLDAIIAVGYRINSVVGTKFRQWATKTLRSYVVDGFAVNKKRIAVNYAQFLSVVEDIKKLLPAGSVVDAEDAVELVSLFADTWLSLDAYDKGVLPKGKLTRKKVLLTTEKISKSLAGLKIELMRKSEVTDIFGKERSEGFVAGIIGNVMQSFGGKELYESAEEKAAHLLYFMVKDHPFLDGNKRSGAFAFVWFLKQASILDVSKLTPSALTALTILVACSDLKDKDKVISLILNLIAKK